MSKFTNITVYICSKVLSKNCFRREKISFNNLFFVIYFAGDHKLSGSSLLSNG